MIYIRVSSNRMFIVNEYWVLIPLMLYIDYCIITKMKKTRAGKEEIEIKYKQLKIFALATGSMMAVLAIRGGQESDVFYPNYIVGEGLRYVDNDHIRRVVHSFFKHKQIDGVIHITQTALCYLAENYNIYFPATPIPIPDFIKLSNYYQPVRKTIVAILIGMGIPMTFAIGALSSSLGMGLIIAGFFLGSYNVEKVTIPTSLIVGSIKFIGRRILDVPDVVSVNIRPELDYKIEMPKNQSECLLPDQRLTNPKCRTESTEITIIPENIQLNYDNIVNIKDVTGLKGIEFVDKYEVNPSPKKLFENLRGGGIPKFFKKIKIPNKSIIFYLAIATASLNTSTRTTRMLPENQTPIIQQRYRNGNDNDNENNNSVTIKAGNHMLTFKRNKKEME